MDKMARTALKRFERGEPTARDVARLAAAFDIAAEPEDKINEAYVLRGLDDALRQLRRKRR